METNSNLRAIVDMGSNGIRFSINDLSPPTARLLPTIYQSRAAISLYDAQYPDHSNTKCPIPQSTISQVLTELLRFKRTCADFHVSTSKIRVLATEATREAVNSREFLGAISQATGWQVEMLPKEQEGLIGALGVASGFNHAEGLAMDLGGGSTQLTWLQTTDAGEVERGTGGSASLPYGAAALLRRLGEAEEKGQQAKDELAKEVQSRLRDAFSLLGVPQDVLDRARSHDNDDGQGIDLYLSGGGFRGWGYALMGSDTTTPYPIPLINGFTAPNTTLSDTVSVLTAVGPASTVSTASSGTPAPGPHFRLSERRIKQLPAVAFLITSLNTALAPHRISQIRFAQGGLREGALFSSLPTAQRLQNPLVVATSPYAPPGALHLAALLSSALPPHASPAPALAPHDHPFNRSLITAISNMLLAHSPLPKDLRAAAALRTSTTGLLASAHGITHRDRALLALVLWARWGGELSALDAQFLCGLRALLGVRAAWWCEVLGRVAALVGAVWPAGVVGPPARQQQEQQEQEEEQEQQEEEEQEEEEGKAPARLSIHAAWGSSGKKGARCVQLVVRLAEGSEAMAAEARAIEKAGKKKRWVRPTAAGGEEEHAWGMKVKVDVVGADGRALLRVERAGSDDD